MAHWTKQDNWLQGIHQSNDINHSIKTDGSLTPAMVQAAFNKTYGPNLYNARDHGTVITVFSVPAYTRYVNARIERYRAKGDMDYVAELEARIECVKADNLTG